MNLSRMRASKTVKKRDMGLASVAIVVSQIISSFQSSQSITREISQLKEEVQQIKFDREQLFVRKTDLVPITLRLDKMNEQLDALTQTVNLMKRTVDEYALNDESCQDNLFTKATEDRSRGEVKL